jgi:hypothetical protein
MTMSATPEATSESRPPSSSRTTIAILIATRKRLRKIQHELSTPEHDTDTNEAVSFLIDFYDRHNSDFDFLKRNES